MAFRVNFNNTDGTVGNYVYVPLASFAIDEDGGCALYI
jgi:hypothetical protein